MKENNSKKRCAWCGKPPAALRMAYEDQNSAFCGGARLEAFERALY
jgi:hypothetical protein